jgi:hypothetical protein
MGSAGSGSPSKHLPDADVAKAGGWRSIGTMKRAYQLADDAGVLEAVLETRKLKEPRGYGWRARHVNTNQ